MPDKWYRGLDIRASFEINLEPISLASTPSGLVEVLAETPVISKVIDVHTNRTLLHVLFQMYPRTYMVSTRHLTHTCGLTQRASKDNNGLLTNDVPCGH